mmetsp:Transcript_53817/g.172540  ORF Transcript_53817/g.172540 Transcript_53817/m.172540 type:complete len:389 (+) Transcript_53817:492-1658(+)
MKPPLKRPPMSARRRSASFTNSSTPCFMRSAALARFCCFSRRSWHCSSRTDCRRSTLNLTRRSSPRRKNAGEPSRTCSWGQRRVASSQTSHGQSPSGAFCSRREIARIGTRSCSSSPSPGRSSEPDESSFVSSCASSSSSSSSSLLSTSSSFTNFRWGCRRLLGAAGCGGFCGTRGGGAKAGFLAAVGLLGALPPPASCVLTIPRLEVFMARRICAKSSSAESLASLASGVSAAPGPSSSDAASLAAAAGGGGAAAAFAAEARGAAAGAGAGAAAPWAPSLSREKTSGGCTSGPSMFRGSTPWDSSTASKCGTSPETWGPPAIPEKIWLKSSVPKSSSVRCRRSSPSSPPKAAVCSALAASASRRGCASPAAFASPACSSPLRGPALP